MLFAFGLRSSLLLPFVVPGLAAGLWLLGRAWWRGTAPDVLLPILLLLPTLGIARWMLGYAGWYDSHDGYTTFMFYMPWDLGLALGPAYYLYFRSLTNQEFDWRQMWQLLPGLVQGLARPLAALYDLGWLRGVQHQLLPYHFGTLGPAAKGLDALQVLLGWVGRAVLLVYGVRVLGDYRRYRHYLDANFSNTGRLRFAGLQQLLVVQAAVLALNLLFLALDAALDFSYDAAWNFYAVQGPLIYGLVVVGLQANYAAASSPLLFGAARPQPLPSKEMSAAELAPVTSLPLSASEAPAPDEPVELPAELEPWRAKLLALMATERPWLEPELTLDELAQRLHTYPALFSKVINAGCKQNFNDFVNTYRVQEVRRKLAAPSVRALLASSADF